MSMATVTDEGGRAYTEWCARHGCQHAHCPHGCEHPQPIVLPDGRCVCGRCLICFGEFVEVLPCTPEVCD